MVYIDNAATSFPKPKSVIYEVKRCLKKYCGNPGRGSHSLSMRAAEEIYKSREIVACHIGACGPENIVFTPNATYALNLSIKTLIKNDCHVLCSDFEHNSVIRPLNKLVADRNITYSTFSDLFDLKSKIQIDTKAIVCSIASNVSGEELDLVALSNIAKDYNLILIIDASQALGHKRFNLKQTPCDAFCAPGHKSLFGIQGSGFAYMKQSSRNESFLEGGSGFDSRAPDMPLLLPEAYEAGTLATPAIVSLGKGIEYIEKAGIENISSHLAKLCDKLCDNLYGLGGMKIYGYGNGIVSFNVRNYASTEVSSYLNSKGICVRGGLHCAPSIHKRLGTLDCGVVRASFSYFNKDTDVDKITSAIKELIK